MTEREIMDLLARCLQEYMTRRRAPMTAAQNLMESLTVAGLAIVERNQPGTGGTS
jgi:hypothetical protein